MFMSYYLLVIRRTDGCDEGWSISQRINVARGASNGSGFDDEEYVLILVCCAVYICVYLCVRVYMCLYVCVLGSFFHCFIYCVGIVIV